MSSFPSTEKAVLVGSLLYLLIPNLLFLGGWFQPWVAITCGLALLFCITQACINISQQKTIGRLNLKHCLFLFCLAIFALLSQFWVGYTGHFSQFPLDFANRNATYGNLCDKDWPLVLPDGRYICFYLAQFLPAAFLSKILPWADRMSLLMIWNMLGMVLALALLAFHFRLSIRKTCFLLLFILVLNDPVVLLKPFLFPLVQNWTSIPISMNPQFYDLEYQMRSTIQHAVPTLLATMLVFHSRIPQKLLPLVSVMLLPISVFGAIGILPYTALKYFETKKGQIEGENKLAVGQAIKRFFTSLPGYVSLALLFLTSLFFSHADGAATITTIFHITFGKPLWYIIAKSIFHAGIILLMLFLPILSCRKTIPHLFWVSFLTLSLVNLVYIGKAGPNELAFKGQLSSLYAVGTMWVGILTERKRLIACAYILILFLLFLYNKAIILSPRMMDFGWKEDHITNPYRGHLYHPGAHINQILPPRKKVFIEGFTYEKAGESRHIFPFSLLPPDNPNLYRRPAHYKPQEEFLKHATNEEEMHIIPLFPHF